MPATDAPDPEARAQVTVDVTMAENYVSQRGHMKVVRDIEPGMLVVGCWLLGKE